MAAADRVHADELAIRVGTDRRRIDELADLGVIERDESGRFAVGDVHRIRLLGAFEAAGVPLDPLVAASRDGRISLRYYDELHPSPLPLSGRTYRSFRVSFGPDAALLDRLYAALGLAQPADDARLTVDDEALLTELIEIIQASGAPDLALRAIRLFGEGARKAADGALGVYGEAAARLGDSLTGLPVDDQFDRLLRPWARFAQQAGRLAGWLASSHLTRAIDEYSVMETERTLEAAGFVPARTVAQPAVAFVDLTGFTRLTEERGDEAAAAVALRLGELATEVIETTAGRVVKLLGDGVLLRFGDAVAAMDGSLDLLDALPRTGLPPGHAGVATGPLIVRDNDVFGRTVNLASRIADVARSGQLFTTSESVASLSGGLPGRFRTRPVQATVLPGIGRVDLVEVVRERIA